MLRDLALASALLALAGGGLLAVLVIRRVTLARRDQRSAEKRLTPLAMAIAFEDTEVPVLSGRDVAILATLLAGLSARLEGASRERISEYFVRHGHIREEVGKLSDRRTWRRATAAYVLGDMGSLAAVPALVATLQDAEREVRAAAARSLGRLQATEAVAALVAALAARRVPRGIIGQALLAVGPGAVERLRPLLGDPEPEVRATAAELIGLLGDAGEAERLIGRLSDSAAAVRQQAALALGRLGSATAFEGLAGALADRAPRVRAAAAEALGAIADPGAFAALLDLAGRDTFEPARAAAQALVRIDPARLEQAARDPAASPHVLEAADAAALDRAAP
jgi:hypothetical protein